MVLHIRHKIIARDKFQLLCNTKLQISCFDIWGQKWKTSLPISAHHKEPISLTPFSSINGNIVSLPTWLLVISEQMPWIVLSCDAINSCQSVHLILDESKMSIEFQLWWKNHEWRKCPPPPPPLFFTNKFSTIIQMWWKFLFCSHSKWNEPNVTKFRTWHAWQLCCRGMCKNL